MTKDEIPAFIEDLVAIGCNPLAMADDDYWFIGDADLPEPLREQVQEPIVKICDRYGPRDHLYHEIIDHLRDIGRIPDFQKQ
ncbi:MULTISPECIES: hypothetical protein [Agrobacterium]|uniref:Uncharacterized protein n=1 Tax=Agrobacterium leguminum TaxID=2792015 RepID=A0A9X3QY49_9HYPH|nr:MULTISPECIES: hypothetical protein [Agrobacterium]MCZ7890005.1 hypothetical protein [Agrobacterium salinitolerans]MCZ7912940.1 hypothetical protein [Agrobacterium leguminum]